MPSREDTVPEDAKAEEWAKKGNAFTTGPGGKVTHWKQGVLLIDQTKQQGVARRNGQKIEGTLEYAVPEDNSRALNVTVKWKVEGAEQDEKQLWKMR